MEASRLGVGFKPALRLLQYYLESSHNQNQFRRAGTARHSGVI
jgi:hypothetical protein